MAAVGPLGELGPSSVEGLTRALVDIDSTTGREQEVAEWLSAFLLDRGYRVTEQAVSNDRFNVFAHLETFHKTRHRPKGEVQTFARMDPRTMVPYTVDTEDFGSVLLTFGASKHGFVKGTHANASISQVAAGWKCSLALGIYGKGGRRQRGRGVRQEPQLIHTPRG